MEGRRPAVVPVTDRGRAERVEAEPLFELLQGGTSDGSAVVYKEGNGCSRLIEDPDEVLRQRSSYDRLRDLALSPSDSLAFIRDVLEEHRS
ncbi:Scr1 family TA system antitoxin-like transcriptional regulator [Streptomyces sp. YU58]|uniref:Scr1 family TA system antitoxin-like transcriptional regulator n=1 Tax=Streptomyces sp. SX92 TaxID=3158972 RepID=UPI0027BA434E|nr:Scr1 family TA system antitoxin-like transcriptional regulator [Streptomyces coralus]WLW58546.1 Scr1 family TA system antitoxin-like transcriptional regulator [Streptomyces coralus]